MGTLEEKRFADIAVEQGLASQVVIESVQAEVDETVMEGTDTNLLDTLVQKGVISQPQKTQIIQAAEASGPIRLGEFEIERLLGRGGMGTVYRAREISMDRSCALKLLPVRLAHEPGIVSRFRREAQTSAKLDHPNIVRGYRVGEVDGQHYFAMELVEGTSVGEMLTSGPLDIDESVKIIKQIGGAHNAGIIHRDIKPDNIMVTKDGVVKLADLGLAKASDTEQTRLTMSGVGMGTPAYMPPEQALGAKHADARSDIYSLGATFYHMVTGRMPYDGSSAYEVMQMHQKGVLKSPRALRPDVPPRLDLIIGKMMQRKPENRFQTADELVEALERHSAPPAVKQVAAPRPAKSAQDKYWHLRIPVGGGKGPRVETNALTAASQKAALSGGARNPDPSRVGQRSGQPPLPQFMLVPSLSCPAIRRMAGAECRDCMRRAAFEHARHVP